ncbi:MAG: cyanophycin synthetase [Candidatus Methylopumilus sp.]|nr:cyanophycin synthetase [Candidatus Methylopumilus sp.]
MDVSRIRALRGPNLWTRLTAIEAVVTCTDREANLDQLPEFLTQLRARFPDVKSLRPFGHKDPITMAHALEAVSLGLQAAAGCPVAFGQTMSTPEHGVFQIVFQYTEEPVGRLALDLAQTLCVAALNNEPFDITQALSRLRELDEDVRLGPSTGSIVNAATARGIPYRRLTEGSLVQFGWGSKQQRIQAAETGNTSAIAEAIAQDKDLTKMLLEAAGVPVPRGFVVEDENEGWDIANKIGLPVVVKPRDGNQGKGVAVNIETREQLNAAFKVASEISRDVIVEQYIPGHDFRMLVIGNQLVAAARRDPPTVIGDGKHTVAQLVDQVNADPLRGDGHATALTKIRFDEIALATLATQGLDAQSIPEKGKRVLLRNNANLSTGGSATDVTDEVHPELAARMVTAAQMVGLDIAGVDLVAETILKPMEEQRAGIVEINAAPGLRMHLSPSFGKPRQVGEAIISSMFAAGDNARIPVVAVTGTNGKTTTVRLTSHLLRTSGKRVGMTNSDGVYIEQRCIDTGDCSGPRSARNVLLHPDVDAAVFETARGGILREGLAFDRCDVAIVTNIGVGDHLGMNFINTVDTLALLKRVIVQNVAPHGTAVLNAADPMVAKMAEACPGTVIFFSLDRLHPVLNTHRAQGKRVVFCDNGQLVCSEAGQDHSIALSAIPLTRNGTISFQIENAMASVAAAWALGLSWKTIEAGMATFVNDAQTAPGRFNVFDYRGGTIIADYGHNPDAVQALVQAIESMPATKRTVVISGAGDRRDEDISRQTEILGEIFDEAILYQDQCQRGREDGEVLALLQLGLKHVSRTKEIQEIRGEFLAIDTALAKLKPGQLCLILIDQVQEALDHIAKRIAEDQN